MLAAFRNRRPVGAAVIGAIFGPVIGMLYLGKGRAAIGYLIVVNLAWAALMYISLSRSVAWLPTLTYLFNLIGLIHGYREARKLPANARMPWFSRWYSILGLYLVPVFGLALTLRSFLFEPFTIPSQSMAPTVQAGDYIFASKYAYGFNRYSLPFSVGPREKIRGAKPQRGDVVILRWNGEDYIKRVIGLPGDRVQLKEGEVYLNGKALPEAPAGELNLDGEQPGQVRRETLPSGRSYTILNTVDGSRGDNTGVFTVPPDNYFVLGDNRDNSMDSRFDIGFVPFETIFARAALLAISPQDSERDWTMIK